MSKVSLIMTARNESYEVSPGVTVLQRMVRDIYEKCTGDFEVLIAQDGAPYVTLEERPNLKVFNRNYEGLKPQINFLANQATGKYLLKFDAHCMVSPGIDEVLQADMEDNWMVMPRFYVLNAEEWKWQDDRFFDYFFMSCPVTDPKGYRIQAGGHWRDRTDERIDGPTIDDTMHHHGSGWFVTRDFFLNKLGGMSSYGYGNMFMEPAELCNKTWLGPWNGRVMVNKKCWYAHAHKGKQRPRGYGISMREVNRSYNWCANYWMRNCWPERVHDIDWLVDGFYPVPTWPDNWRELQAKYEQEHPWQVTDNDSFEKVYGPQK